VIVPHVQVKLFRKKEYIIRRDRLDLQVFRDTGAAIKSSVRGANRSYDGPRLTQNVSASSYGVVVGLRISSMHTFGNLALYGILASQWVNELTLCAINVTYISQLLLGISTQSIHLDYF